MTPDSRRETWERPALTYEGNLEEIVLAGGGKISATAGDPGDTPFKQKSSG